ncbi:MAG: phosphoenolpyruvate carboxykinase (ATP) [Pseudomonadota bacterium]
MKPATNISRPDDYVIPDTKQLIIIDAHDTFLKRDFSRTLDDLFGSPRKKKEIVWILRDGVLNFLEYFHGIKNMKIVISSDGEEGALEEHCSRFGIFIYISRIYGIRHIDKYNYVKRLDLILKDLQIEAQKTVFIGDGKIDQVSCKKYGIDFIEVPNTLDRRNFSFNAFLHLDFSHGQFGLELQKISNLRKIHHNLHTPELVEEALRNKEGKLAHLGALVIQTKDIHKSTDFNQYIVREPSSELCIHWSGKFKSFDIERFNLICMRLLAFLQDREIYIQDCFAGADPSTQIPLRILTQTAWHNLLIRTMFIQATEENMEKFFPEYTIIHVPHFKAVPEFDGMESEDFVLINLLKKVVIVGGTHLTEQIRTAVFTLLSYKLPQEDIIPVRCASNKGKNKVNDLALFFGEIDYRKSYITMDPKRYFLGDDYHGWSNDAVFNIEWGCRVPVYHMKRRDNPSAFETTRKFATLLVNVAMDENRKLDFFSPQTSFHASASFPITHLNHADRSGISKVPKNIFIFQSDAIGVFPPLASLTREQAVYYLLMGYRSHREKTQKGVRISVSFQPLFCGNIFIFPPATYAMLLWERMERSQTNCWLVNSHHIGNLDHQPKFINQDLLARLVHGVYDEAYTDENMRKDPVWGFDTVSMVEGIEKNHLNPELAWEDEILFRERSTELLAQFKKHFEPFAELLSKPILDTVPH